MGYRLRIRRPPRTLQQAAKQSTLNAETDQVCDVRVCVWHVFIITAQCSLEA